jgi:hypothetical protein
MVAVARVFNTLREHDCTESEQSCSMLDLSKARAVALQNEQRTAEPALLDVRRASAAERLQQAYEAAQLARTHWTRGVDRVGRPARSAMTGPRRKSARGGQHSTRLELGTVSSPPFRAPRPFHPPPASAVSERGDGAAATLWSPSSVVAGDAAGVRTHTHPLQDHLCGGAVLHIEGQHAGEIVATVPRREVPSCRVAGHSRQRRLFAASNRERQAPALEMAGRVQSAWGEAGPPSTSSRAVVADAEVASPALDCCGNERGDEDTSHHQNGIAAGAAAEGSDANMNHPVAGQTAACSCASEPSRPEPTHRRPRRLAADEALPPALPYLFEGDLEGDLGETGHACDLGTHGGVADCGGWAVGADPSATDMPAVCCAERHRSGIVARDALPTVSHKYSAAGLRMEEAAAAQFGADVTSLREGAALREQAPLSQTSTRGKAPPVLKHFLGRCREVSSGRAESVESQPETPLSASGLSPEAERVAPQPTAAQPPNAQPWRPQQEGPDAQPLPVAPAKAPGSDGLASPRRYRAPQGSPAALVRSLFEGVGTPPAEPAGRTPPTTFVRMVETVEHLLHQLEGPELNADCSAFASTAPPARSAAALGDSQAETRGASAVVRGEGDSGSAASRLEDYLAAYAAAETPPVAAGTCTDRRRARACGGSLPTPATQPLLIPPSVPTGQEVYLQHIRRRAAAGQAAGLNWAGDEGPRCAAADQMPRDAAASPPPPGARRDRTLADVAGAEGVRAHATEASVPGVLRASAPNSSGEMMRAGAMGPAVEESEIGSLSELRRSQAKDLLRRMRSLAAAPHRRASRADAERAAAAAEAERRVASVLTGAAPLQPRRDVPSPSQQPRPSAGSSAGDAGAGFQSIGGPSSLLEPRAGAAAFPPERGREADLWSDGRFRRPPPLRVSDPARVADRVVPSQHAAPGVRMSIAAQSAPHPPLSTPPRPPPPKLPDQFVAAAPAGDVLSAFLTCSGMAAIASATALPSAVAEIRKPRQGPPARSLGWSGYASEVWSMSADPPTPSWPMPPTGAPHATALPSTVPSAVDAQWTSAPRPSRACREARPGCGVTSDFPMACRYPQSDVPLLSEAGRDSIPPKPLGREESHAALAAAATAGLTARHSVHALLHAGQGEMERGSKVHTDCGSGEACTAGCVPRATGGVHCGAEPSRSQPRWPSTTPPLPGPAGRSALGATAYLAPTVDGLAVQMLSDPLRGDTGSTGDWDAYTEALHDVYAEFFAVEAAGNAVRAPTPLPISSSTLPPMPRAPSREADGGRFIT